MENNYDSDDLWTTEGWNEHIKSLKIVLGRKIIIERKNACLM